LLVAAAARFPTATLRGLELDRDHVARARAAVPAARVVETDAFATDWRAELAALAEPTLVVGNPPWVTVAELARLGSANAPARGAALGGLDAVTGKSNFDVCEWLMLRLCEGLDGRRAVLAMLCKTAVARRVLAQVWRRELAVGDASLYAVNAPAAFGAAVDAGFLVLPFAPGARSRRCARFPSLDAGTPSACLGVVDGELLADLDAHAATRSLAARSRARRWRSGIKHDCAEVMELWRDGTRYRNALGERVELEPAHVYPLCKGSDLAAGRGPSRWLVVPQSRTGEPTDTLADTAPKTHAYLERHAARLAARRSRVYRDRPRFAVFGVGAYSFAAHKVAVAGLYKAFRFRALGPHEGRPVVVDDTSYALAMGSAAEAAALAAELNGPRAQAFFAARVFWDAKRPVTAGLLGQLDLDALLGAEFERMTAIFDG
jgi:hypothetical protein